MSSCCDQPAGQSAEATVKLAVTDKFSWLRVAMLARFYYPVLRKQIIAIPSMVFLCVLLLSYSQIFESDKWVIVSTMPVSFMFILSPLGLARRDCRSLSNQLPVTPLEKMAFLVLYFNVFMTILTSGGMSLSALILLPISDQPMTWLLGLFSRFEETFGMSPFNPSMLVGGCFFQYCVLYGVISAKKNRIARGIIWMLVTFVIYQFMSGIIGLIIGIVVAASESPEALANLDAMGLPEGFMPYVFRSILAVMTLGTLVMASLTYRKLKYHGF